MNMGELQDLARQVAERTVPWPKWVAAVRSAISAAGVYDDRLEQIATVSVAVAAGTGGSIAMPTGYMTGQILGVFQDHGNGRLARLMRWRITDSLLPTRRAIFAATPLGAEACTDTTWDMPMLGTIVLAPVPQVAITLQLRLRYLPINPADEVPEWLQFGALEWLGKNVFQDTRAGQWGVQFRQDMEGAVCQGITATSHPISLRR